MRFGKTLKKIFLEKANIDDPEKRMVDLSAHAKSANLPTKISDLLKKLSFIFEGVDSEIRQFEKNAEISDKSLKTANDEVTQLNKDLKDLNIAVGTLLNSLDDGYLTFDLEGNCSEVVSRAAFDMIGDEQVTGRKLWDILEIDPIQCESFQDWYRFLVDEKVKFEDLAALGPTRFPSKDKSKNIRIRYIPMRDRRANLVGVAMQLADITDQEKASRVAEEERQYSQMVINYIRDKRTFINTLVQVKELAKYLCSWKESNDEANDIFAIMRKLHTLKGASATLFMNELSDFIDSLESSVTKYIVDDTGVAEAINEIGVKLHEKLEDYLHNELDFISAKEFKKTGTKEVPVDVLFNLIGYMIEEKTPVEVIDKYVRELVCVPFDSLFSMPEAAALSRAMMLQKEVQFSVKGESDFLVIGEAYESFFAEFRHLIHNCLDHGIESPAERRRCGKDSSGTIAIEYAAHTDLGRLELWIRDDGRGIDPAKVREKLDLRKVDHQHLSDREVLQHIFDDGISTRDNADMFAGRGVGMSALKKAVESIGGSVSVESQLGKGTCFHVDLPIIDKTLARTYRLFKKVG